MVEVIGKVQEHTVECSTSPTLCKPVFKQSCDGRDSNTSIVLTYNNSDVDLPVSCGSGMSVVKNSTHRKNRTPIHPLVETSGFLGGIL